MKSDHWHFQCCSHHGTLHWTDNKGWVFGLVDKSPPLCAEISAGAQHIKSCRSHHWPCLQCKINKQIKGIENSWLLLFVDNEWKQFASLCWEHVTVFGHYWSLQQHHKQPSRIWWHAHTPHFVQSMLQQAKAHLPLRYGHHRQHEQNRIVHW